MTKKEVIIEAIKALPDDAEVEEVMERLLLIAKIERGLEQSDTGETLSHAQVRDRFAKWLK